MVPAVHRDRRGDHYGDYHGVALSNDLFRGLRQKQNALFDYKGSVSIQEDAPSPAATDLGHLWMRIPYLLLNL